MASVTNSSTGYGYPYPNTLTLNVSTEARDNNRHVISWSVVATGGASGNWQQVFNGLAGWRVSGASGWNFVWGSGASVQAWAGATLASSSFDYWHTDYVKLKFIIGGGYYSSANYSENTMYVELPELYTAPAAPTAENLASDGTPHRAYSKVTNNGWGTNSSRRNFEIINAGRIVASDYDHSPASMYWTLDAGSNDTNACYVHTWYGRAVNNHVLWTDSGAKYIATPSAPILSITAGSGTSPSTTVEATLKYKGGTQKSSSCDNGTMRRWQFGKMLQSDSGIPTSFQSDIDNSNVKTKSYTWTRSNFDLGKNYKFYVRTVNTLGGASSSTSQVIYCPTGVNGTMTARTTESLTLKASYNYAGEINSSTSGAISCYQIKWSTNKSTVDSGGGTALSMQTGNTFTINGLNNNQTIYYRVYAWNIYGLSNVSSTLSATTLPRYTPSLTNINATPLSPGAHVSFKILNTGGLTPTELVVSSIEISRRASNASTYTTLKTITGLSLHANDSYTIQNAWNDVASAEGDYVYKIHLSNGTDVSDTTFILQAPTKVTMTTSLTPNEPIQIQAKGNASSVTQLYKWDLISTSTGQSKTFNTSSTSPTIVTSNHLSYNTNYVLKMRAYNTYGLWRDSSTVTQTTLPRFQFYSIAKGTTNKTDAIFKNKKTESPISDVYYIVKNSLGSLNVGDNLENKRLTFIKQSLRYRPENVASMLLADGRKIAYAYDSTDDLYKFGIWRGNTLETVFHDGWNWQATEYKFEESAIISAVSGNLNASAAFSTTKCENIPLWERENITGYGRIVYYTDNTYTTTARVDIPNQSSVNALKASDSGSGGGKNLINTKGRTGQGSAVTYQQPHPGIFVVNSDGASGVATFNVTNADFTLPAGTYTLSANNSTSGQSGWQIKVRNIDASSTDITSATVDMTSTHATRTFTLSTATKINIYLRFPKNAIINDFTVMPQLESGSLSTSFEPFTGGLPTSSWSATVNGATITNENIKSIVLTSSVTNIPDYFLANSNRLQSVVTADANVTSIGNYICYGCTSLLTASLPNSITSIPSYIFYNCSNLNKTMVLPTNVTSIGSYFMAFCTRQNQNITLPNNLVYIYNYFMSGCGIFDQPMAIPNSVEYIGDYFMSANLLFDRDFALPTSLTHLGEGFLYNCLNMTHTINVGALASTVAVSSNNTLATLQNTAACYVTGITIKGTNQANWVSRFGRRDASPYRYTKEYEEPIIIDRDWDYDNCSLDNYNIGCYTGLYGGLPWSDIWSIQETDTNMLAQTAYLDMYSDFDNYETAYDIAHSLPFTTSNGKCYIPYDENHLHQFVNVADFSSADTILRNLKIVKNPTIALQWTSHGSSTIATGINDYWQGSYDTPNGWYNPIVEWSGGIGTSTANIVITASELVGITDPENYYIATLSYFNGVTGIYFSGLDANHFNSTTGTATIYAGNSGGPLMLFHYVVEE